MGEERGWRGRRVAELEREYLELDARALVTGPTTRQDKVRSEMNSLRPQFDVDDASSYQRRRRELQRA